MVDATIDVLYRGGLECDQNYMIEGQTLASHDEPNPDLDYDEIPVWNLVTASDPERFAEVAEMLGADTDGVGTRAAADLARSEYVRLQQDLNVIPSGLAELADVDEEDVDWLANQTVETQQRLLRCNPRPVTKEDAADIFRDALHNWE